MYWILFSALLLRLAFKYLHKTDNWLVLRSLGLLAGMLIVNILCSSLLLLGILWIDQHSQLLEKSSSFSILAFVTFITGIILYYALALFQRRFRYSKSILTLIEYYIQWILVFVTLYQVIFEDQFKNVAQIKQLSLLAPTDLIVGLFPALISSWIAIVLYKLTQNEL